MNQSKIALITGGSRGLGRDMAIALSKKNVDVVFTYHSNQSAAEEVVKAVEANGQNAKAFQLNTANTNEFDNFHEALVTHLNEQYGHSNIDFLINNAGTGTANTIAETTEQQFDEMLNIHLKGVFFFTQKMLGMINDGGGIINISSGLARFSFPGMSAYAIMKGGIEVFTRYLAKELGNRKIKANVVAPGAIATDFAGGTNRDDEDKRQIISSITALGKVGEAEDIGGVVAFLCSEEASWVNGQRIEVSGGMLL